MLAREELTSTGGHYGPAFYNHFYKQNQMIKNGSVPGYPLNFVSLGIGNGIIDEAIQVRALLLPNPWQSCAG